ncbi:MAG: DUF5320 domain-containing protein [Spirochaetes bacterium]|nr:DUF5320 domain-containing protein [Spirochaetota bacterium]
MPGFNRTGPLGQGPMTGRGMGMCGGNAGAGSNRGFGRMFSAWGRGCRGRGGFNYMGNFNPMNTEETVENLKKQKEILEQRISALEKGSGSDE